MTRNFNTTVNESAFSADIKRLVWNKGRLVPGRNPNQVRKDICGALIEWDKYGDTTENGTGWEIDHIRPKSLAGNDILSNLQPLQWQNNRAKGDQYPALNYCVVPAK